MKIVAPLLDCKPSSWDVSWISDELVPNLRGYTAYNFRECSSKSIEAYWNWIESWNEFLETHVEIRRALDPAYVICCFGGAVPAGAAAPGGWGASIGLVPAAVGPAALNGTDYIYSVAGGTAALGKQNARRLGGFLQGRHPGLSWGFVWTTNPLVFF